MLTADTKRHIDSARQVLVGKVPDPKQQIDQVTNALIYKFMDDMDVQAKDAGGKPSFFTGDLEKYAWRKLMDPRRGSQERLNLYTEALQKFSTAKQLPQLFRDIFRQAFLPYRDPETLNLFLKEIEFFDYSHSEELGNAFEYLLSIMGSQGDAGQFRTPRHIIDFIVDVIDPDKDDTILDPACGTAGFLISAYKHIVDKHSGKDKKPLTHSEKQKLMNNLDGYDISSDMVKLARVNMYLHGNNQPKIYEYDSLSSEEHWGDMFDVIMANPPFMSPKGGIRPHSKFGVESSRSEVLFVDYIMSHLKQNGRAGIIVPEGVIFQSGKSYKQLRKALVEDGLMAVISLPAGVFNPYAGVKTSILIFDNNRAKKSQHVVFVKVDHDGFELGAQRRPAPAKNDLPIIANTLRRYRLGKLTTQEQIDEYLADVAAIHEPGSLAKVIDIKLVERSKIAQSSDHNLSASRYIVSELLKNTNWPIKELSDVVDIFNGSTPLKTNSEFWDEGDVPWFTVEDIRSQGRIIRKTTKHITKEALDKTSVKILPKETVLLCCTASVGEYAYTEIELTTNQQFNGLVVKNKNTLSSKFLFWLASTFKDELERLSGKTSFNFVSVGTLKKIKIPLPPIDVQRQIVEELNSYQKIINGIRQVEENYRPNIKVDSSWPRVKLKHLIKSLDAGVSVNSESRPRIESEKGVLKTSAVTRGVFKPSENKSILSKELSRVKISPKRDNIIISRMNTLQLVGASAYIDKDYDSLFLPDRLWQTVRSNNDFSMKYLFYVISSQDFRKKMSEIAGGTSGSMKNISKTSLLELEVPLPSLDIQTKIVQTIEEMEIGINANKKMHAIYEQKIKDKIAEVWSA